MLVKIGKDGQWASIYVYNSSSDRATNFKTSFVRLQKIDGLIKLNYLSKLFSGGKFYGISGFRQKF